jgi:hypothetical protein
MIDGSKEFRVESGVTLIDLETFETKKLAVKVVESFVETKQVLLLLLFSTHFVYVHQHPPSPYSQFSLPIILPVETASHLLHPF